MKLFIKKILLFTFFSLILSLVWMSIFYVVENKQERIVFVEPHITDIFMGDSHIQCAINDTILTNAKNFALQTEPYFLHTINLAYCCLTILILKMFTLVLAIIICQQFLIGMFMANFQLKFHQNIFLFYPKKNN